MTYARRRPMRRAAARFSLALCLAATTVAAQPRKPKPKPQAVPRPHAPTAPSAAAAAPTAGNSIPVTVIEVAGTAAYLQPGASGGVHRGSKVVINRSEYAVIQTTASYAVIDVFGAPPPHEQERGLATIVSEDDEKARELVKPRPLSAWEQAWTEAPSLASEQTPRFVPLGGVERDRRWDVRLSMAGGALVPLLRGPSTVRAELNTRIHAEPFAAPLAFDLDLSVQQWAGSGIGARDGSSARPLIWLREMLVGYGSGGWYAGVGRMRYAASTLGTLDGARVNAPLGGGFSAGAFGGVLPNPLSGAPSVAAQRFGVETTFSRPELALRPEAALVLQGSTFGGSLDERRLSGMFGIYPGLSRVGGHFEVSNFASNNEWKASPIELTAAGVDGSVRAGIFQFGARVDVRQPERSRWLSSFLPTWWFCRTVPVAAGGGNEQCDGSVSTRALGAVDASVELGQVSVTVGATTIGDLTQKGGAPDMKGGFAGARVVRIAKIARVDVSTSYSQATYLKMYGGSAGPGVTLFDEVLDVSAYYRNATLAYRALDTTLVQHGFGGVLMLFPASTLLFSLQGEAVAGNDAHALMLFGTALWRPRL